MKELYTQSKKEAVSLFKKCMGVMIVLMVMFYVLKNFVLFPIVGKVWSLALSTVPAKYVTDTNAIQFLKYPQLLFAGALIVIIYCIVIVWELSAIMMCCAYYDQNRPVNLLKLIYLSLFNIRHLAKRKNWLFFVYVLIILPYTDLYSAAGMVSSIATPEYIAEFINHSTVLTVLLWALYIFLVWITVRWFYLLQGVLINRQDMRTARQNSVLMIKGRMIRQSIGTLLFGIDRLIKTVLIPYMLSLAILYISARITKNVTGEFLGVKIAYYYLFRELFTFVANSFLSMAVMSYMVVNYRVFATKLGIYVKPELPAEGDKKGHIHLFRHLGTAIYAGIVILSVFIYTATLILANFAPEQLGIFKSNILIAAHKGMSSEAPENTMDSFEKAFECGNVNLIEFDVRESKDGIPIIIHNASLKSACGVDREVYDLAYADIRMYKADYNYTSEEYPDAYVPTLEEVLSRFAGSDVMLLVEIKADQRTPDLPEKVVDLIHKYNCTDSCVIQSGNYETLEEVKKLDSTIPCGYIIAMGAGRYYDLPAADFFSVEHNFVNEKMIQKIHSLGKKVYVWTVDEETSIEDILMMDVDVVITDYPDNIHDAFYTNNDLIDSLVNSAREKMNSENREKGEQNYRNGDY